MVLTGWQSMPADAGGTKASTVKHRKPRRPAGASAGRSEEALSAAELPCRWRAWNRQRHHKIL